MSMLRLFYLLTLSLAATICFAGPQDAAPQELLHNFAYQGGAVPVAFFDADSTLRVSKGAHYAPANASEVMMLPGVAEKIAELTQQGYFVAIVSNQVGSAHRTSLAAINEAMQATIQGAESKGGVIQYFDYSVSEDHSKPHTAMADILEKKLQEKFGGAAKIDRTKSFMVGDAAYRKPDVNYPGDIRPDGQMGFDFENFDRKFAENNGIAFHEPQEFFGWSRYGITRFLIPSDVDEYWEKRKERWSEMSCELLFR